MNDRTFSKYLVPDGFEYDQEALKLPFLHGYGTVPHLSVAMTQDPDLLSQVKSLVELSGSLSAEALRSAIEDLVVSWTGAGTPAEGSRGPYIDAQHLSVLEKFFGSTFVQTTVVDGGDINNPGVNAGAELEKLYQDLIDTLLLRFVIQVPASLMLLAESVTAAYDSPYLALTALRYNSQSDTVDGTLSDVFAAAKLYAPVSLVDSLQYYGDIAQALKGGHIDLFGGDRTQFLSALTSSISGLSPEVQTLVVVAATKGFLGKSDLSQTVSGTSGADVFTSAGGDDILYGNNGSDLYLYTEGDGSDTIIESSSASGETDTLVLTDVTRDGVTLARSGFNLLITIISTGAVINVVDHFRSEKTGLEKIVFADGSALMNRDQILSLFPQQGTSGADTLTGGIGEDLLQGGAGNDLLRGGQGSDRYLFSLGDGQDVVEEIGTAGETDVLVLGPGINAADVTVSQANSGYDLVLAVNGTTDKVSLRYQLYGTAYGVERVEFGDGTVWDYATLFDRSALATAGNDTLYGDYRANTLTGGGGNDTLNGAGGADKLVGDEGNDWLTGGGASDTFQFAVGFGKDIVVDFRSGAASDDVIALDKNAFSDLSAVLANATQVGSDTIITRDTETSITLKNVALSTLHKDDFLFF